MFRKIWFIFCALVFVTPLTWADDTIKLKGKAGEFSINPATLAITISPRDDSATINLTRAAHSFDEVKELKVDHKTGQWYYPHLKMQVKVSIDEQGLRFLFKTDKEQDFQWPVAGLTPAATALVIPDGEGLYIPSHNIFWRKEFKKYSKLPESKYSNLSLSMPFWAIEYPDDHYISYIWTDQGEYTDAMVQEKNRQLYLQNTHHFLKRSHFPRYTVLIHLVGDSPISPAVDYRNLLIDENKFVSLRQKILENANVNKLLGAFHIWVYGDGKSLPMLEKLDQLGIKHAWIGYGYDANYVGKGFNVDKGYVQTAENMGYLIGPYDSFDNAQDPKTSDSITSVWPNHIFPEACIRNADGSIMAGFHNRGCYLSTEALRLRESKEKNIANHLDTVLSKADNSLFLDCDASGPLFEDYSKHHPMSREQDLSDRLERMRYISSTRKLVLGSESGLAWSAGVIAYNNGAFLAFPEAFWPSLRDTKQFGGWWPDNAPKVLFKPYNAPDEFIHASYDPRYRLPLYEAVFHDSVISTDRWELNELKIPALRQTKALLQNLYNVPSIWVLDQSTLEKNKDYFSDYYNFFSPLHQLTGLEALTSFDWLTDDHLVQQTQLGNRLILTANFSNKSYEDIGPHCIEAEWKEDGSKTLFCPKN
jgi:hypothetical protein